jgi:hypothetical protein
MDFSPADEEILKNTGEISLFLMRNTRKTIEILTLYLFCDKIYPVILTRNRYSVKIYSYILMLYSYSVKISTVKCFSAFLRREKTAVFYAMALRRREKSTEH